jgi:hypothetical protein
VPAARTGLLLGLRAVPVVEQGKGIAFVGEPIGREALLAEGAGSARVARPDGPPNYAHSDADRLLEATEAAVTTVRDSRS